MKLIAEIGWNHIGNMDLAKKLIIAAAESGAEYCKFQTWSEKKLCAGSWDNDGRREIYKKAELTKEKHHELFDFCNENKTNFLTTVFNIDDVEFLSKINNKIIKIGSPEVYNKDLIKKCLDNFETVLLSTGASKWQEIEELKNFEKINKLILFHCVSSYPCIADNVNILRMNELKKITSEVGYSGHYDGIEDAIIALCNGATYIEKHFTIDKNLPGRDNKFAILPEQFQLLSNFRDKFKIMNKNKGLDLQECEYDTYKNARGRWSGRNNNKTQKL